MIDVARSFFPNLHTPVPILNGSNPDTGSFPTDALVLISTITHPVKIHWVWLKEYPQSEMAIDLSEETMQIAELDAAPPGGVSILPISAGAEQIFAFSAPGTEVDSPRKSLSFLYPGELAIAVLTADNRSLNGRLRWKMVHENSLKIHLSKVALECSMKYSGNKKRSQECFDVDVKVPSTNIVLPAMYANTWFKQLWGSWHHWKMCNWQSSSVPLTEFELEIGQSGRKLKSEILRNKPLVVAVHGVASTEECAELSRMSSLPREFSNLRVGDFEVDDKSRRLVSQRLITDLHNETSVLTVMAIRFFEVARKVTGFRLFPDGQEPLEWRYYRPGCEYRAHCDGHCGSLEVAPYERVAASHLYCTVADEGGAIIFPRDKLKFTPTVGTMLVSMVNPDPKAVSMQADCPVLKGQMMTATQFYRSGLATESETARSGKTIHSEL